MSQKRNLVSIAVNGQLEKKPPILNCTLTWSDGVQEQRQMNNETYQAMREATGTAPPSSPTVPTTRTIIDYRNTDRFPMKSIPARGRVTIVYSNGDTEVVVMTDEEYSTRLDELTVAEIVDCANGSQY